MSWRTAWRRLQRWTASGIWDRIVDALRAMAPEAGWDAHLLDSSVVRAHAHAAGARKAAGGQALGRSRGGFSTKLHLRADAHGRPVTFHLTGGERHDLIGVGPLFERGALRTGKRGRPRWKPAAVIADKAYSAAWLLDVLRRKRIVPIIPSRADQPANPDFDREVYRERNLVERLVGKLKRFRRVATRCGSAWLCCTDRPCGRTGPYPCPGSCDADVLRAPEIEHAVQHADSDRHLGRLAPVRARA
jgi:transposase